MQSTNKARPVMRELRKIADAVETDVLAPLSAEERRTMISLCDRVKPHLTPVEEG